ncbi:DUF6470 family protein [Paenibacillus sp. R14(2021)]|uniref:DUF6470 family protein n=1 Tax=Paenibacillus sp. R14(2021) TaxID=2859228 RepID=UPI001C6139EB|nr:DUF6470 family protein [Paenibacillus sp. R14(2021)]
MKLPYIQAESQRAQIGIESQTGSYNIQSRPADVEVQTTPTKISAPTPMPELNLNQDRMWEAFNGGKPEAFRQRIYSQMPEIALQGIAHIVEKGNRMGDLRNKQNPIPDIALEDMIAGGPKLEVFGPASFHNVDIEFTINKPDVQIDVGKVDIQVQTHKPEINYQRGGVKIYMQQYPSISFHVAELDLRV